MTIVPISPDTDRKLSYLSTLLGKKRQVIIRDATKYVLKLIKEGKYGDSSIRKT